MSALDFLKNIDKGGLSEELIPELIFLDINMPYLDGFQFLEQFELLSEETKSKMKILVLTSSLSQGDMDRAAEHPRIMEFVNKPLLENVLDSLEV
jgi:CheY-like chemotaxis protein